MSKLNYMVSAQSVDQNKKTVGWSLVKVCTFVGFSTVLRKLLISLLDWNLDLS
jgi:hypothetical protein